MKKIITLFALLSITTSVFAYTPQPFGLRANNNDRERAKRSLIIGATSFGIGTGICIGSYTSYNKKNDARYARLNDLRSRYDNNEISDQEFDASFSEINSEASSSQKKLLRNEIIGGTLFLTGSAFLIDSMIHYRRSSRVTAMASWNGFYLAYRF